MAIHCEFCNNFYSVQVNLIKRFNGDKAKINACLIEENPGYWESYWSSWHNSREYMKSKLIEVESILLTRLTAETYRGILDFKNATIIDTPTDEIEKALVSKRRRKISCR